MTGMMRWTGSPVRAISVCLLVVALSSAATAQEPAPRSPTPAVLHESYYHVPLLDLIPGGRLFRAHVVPVLEELVEAGSVLAWYEAEMPIGSASSVYRAVVLRDSLALTDFRQLLPRVARRSGAAWDTLGPLMTAEREHVWEIVAIRTPSPAAEATWLQHRMFEVSTEDTDNWRGFLDEMTTPVRERSMDAGVLDGWIELRRRDGDRRVTKFLEWYGGWTDIDEFGEAFFAALAADVQRATEWARPIGRLQLEIWRFLPRNSRALTVTAPLTDTERAAVGDTILQLYLESSRTFDSDMGCAEIVDRLAPDGETGSFVAQGQLFEMSGGRDELASMCGAIKRDRLSAHEAVQGASVEMLGRDVAVLVAPGTYTIRLRDGRVRTRQQVVTTVWARRPQGWRRVHLHESWQVE